jgi:hypothetical protein
VSKEIQRYWGFGAIPRHVLELLDVGVVDLEAKLVQLALDIVDNLVAEDTALLEELLHGHGGNDAAGLAFDDALDDALDMVATGGDASDVLVACGAGVAVTRE